MVAASCTDHILGGRGKEHRWISPAPSWDTGLRQPACPLPHTLTDTSTYSYTHRPWRPPLIPSQPELTRTTKIPLVFLYLGREGSSLPPGTGSGTGSGAGWTSTRAGRRGTASSPLLLAACRQIGLGHIGNQGTRIHSPFQGLRSI